MIVSEESIMEKVKQELEELKSSINDSDELNDEPIAQDLLNNITPVLENPGELSFEYHRALLKSMEKAIEAFEIRHPRLVDEIRIIINSLNDLGI